MVSKKRFESKQFWFIGPLGGWRHPGSARKGEFGVVKSQEPEFEVVIVVIAVGSGRMTNSSSPWLTVGSEQTQR